MNRPLYIQNYSSYSILGGDMAQIAQKLFRGERGAFTTVTHQDTLFHSANIDTSDFPATSDPYFNEPISRLGEKAIVGIEGTVQEMVNKYGANRVGVFIGSSENGAEISLDALRHYRKTGAFPKGYTLEKQKADFPLHYVQERLGLKGVCTLQSTACASSATAIAMARHHIYAGLCDAAIVGGIDRATLPVILGFNSLGAISSELSLPFSKNRSGITIGDAAALFVVTREPLNARFKISGIGESADADHITAPRADGEGARLAIQRALDDAGLKPEDIDYVNLHGTGTKLNDSMEGIASHAVFGENTFMSSTKGLTGHTLGAAGALELAFCCMTLSDDNPEGLLPVHFYDGEFDSAIPPLRLVKVGDKKTGIRRCQSNSFAFGGCNVSLIVEKT